MSAFGGEADIFERRERGGVDAHGLSGKNVGNNSPRLILGREDRPRLQVCTYI
jgi:hypothetical protein